MIGLEINWMIHVRDDVVSIHGGSSKGGENCSDLRCNLKVELTSWIYYMREEHWMLGWIYYMREE